jgi:hypothetical protein
VTKLRKQNRSVLPAESTSDKRPDQFLAETRNAELEARNDGEVGTLRRRATAAVRDSHPRDRAALLGYLGSARFRPVPPRTLRTFARRKS